MLFNVHTHHTGDSLKVISIYNLEFDNQEKISGIYSCGIHPWNAQKFKDTIPLKTLETLCDDDHCLAIGECGIDKIKGPEISTQLKVFEMQAKLAFDLKKPMIIHSVKSIAEIMKMHKKIKPLPPWIIHGFRKNYHLAQQLTQLGIMLSLGEPLLYQESLWEIVKKTDLKYLFFESDEKPEEIIPLLYRKAAELKNIEQSMLEIIIQDNFERTFKSNINGIRK